MGPILKIPGHPRSLPRDQISGGQAPGSPGFSSPKGRLTAGRRLLAYQHAGAGSVRFQPRPRRLDAAGDGQVPRRLEPAQRAQLQGAFPVSTTRSCYTPTPSVTWAAVPGLPAGLRRKRRRPASAGVASGWLLEYTAS